MPRGLILLLAALLGVVKKTSEIRIEMLEGREPRSLPDPLLSGDKGKAREGKRIVRHNGHDS